MTQRYREIIRNLGRNEVKFPAAKEWREDQLVRLEGDGDIMDQEEYDSISHEIWRDYYSMIKSHTEEKVRLEEELRDELDRMNLLPPYERVRGVFRPDGKIDFGRAFLLLSETMERHEKAIEGGIATQLKELRSMIQALSVKIDQVNAVTVDEG